MVYRPEIIYKTFKSPRTTNFKTPRLTSLLYFYEIKYHGNLKYCLIIKPSLYDNTHNFNLANSKFEEMRAIP